MRESEGARYYFRRVGDLHDDDVVRKIVELIYSGDFQRRSRWREVSPFWRWLAGNVAQCEMPTGVQVDVAKPKVRVLGVVEPARQ